MYFHFKRYNNEERMMNARVEFDYNNTGLVVTAVDKEAREGFQYTIEMPQKDALLLHNLGKFPPLLCVIIEWKEDYWLMRVDYIRECSYDLLCNTYEDTKIKLPAPGSWYDTSRINNLELVIRFHELSGVKTELEGCQVS